MAKAEKKLQFKVIQANKTAQGAQVRLVYTPDEKKPNEIAQAIVLTAKDPETFSDIKINDIYTIDLVKV